MKGRVEDVRRQRETDGARPGPAPVPDGRDRRLHERRQVHAAQRARRQRGRRRPRTSCSRRSTRPRARSSSATARRRSSPTRWASSTSCRTSSSTRSGRRSRRSPGPTCWSRSSTPSDGHAPSTGRRSRRSSTSSVPATSRASRRSTRPTCSYPGADGVEAGARRCPARCSCRRSTGFGLDTLRAEIAALLASLWEDVDVAVPYAAGELLARVRERGTVDLEYGERDVRVTGRMAPGLAGELRSAAERWEASLAEGVAP